MDQNISVSKIQSIYEQESKVTNTAINNCGQYIDNN